MNDAGAVGEMLRSLCLVSAGVAALFTTQAVPVLGFLSGLEQGANSGGGGGVEADLNAELLDVQGIGADNLDDHSAFFMLDARSFYESVNLD